MILYIVSNFISSNFNRMSPQKFSIRELKSILQEKQNDILVSFQNISLEGDIKFTRQPWNKGNKYGLFFDIVEKKETFQCILWTSSYDDVSKLQNNEFKKISVNGNIVLNKIYGNFQFQVSSFEIHIDKQSYLEKLKNECSKRHLFHNKKKINWFSIKNILLLSKKNTQGYSDFMQQLFIPFLITEIEIPLEGPSTSSTIIHSLENIPLSQFDLILIIRGGGNTTEISNSFDKLELFECLKSSPIPVITAIGHANDTKDKLLITEISDFDIETPTSLAKYINNIFFNTFQYRITKELEKNQELIHSLESKQFKKIESDFHKIVKNWIKEQSSYFIIDCPLEKEIIFHFNGKYYKQTIDLSNEIQINQEELNFHKNLEDQLEQNNIEHIYTMLKSYSIPSFESLFQQWKEVKKEIKLIPFQDNKETCLYRLRGMLLSLQKDLCIEQPIEEKKFLSIKNTLINNT